jgi:hypothetical protein
MRDCHQDGDRGETTPIPTLMTWRSGDRSAEGDSRPTFKECFGNFARTKEQTIRSVDDLSDCITNKRRGIG